MISIDRGDFVVDKKDAYLDNPLPIGHGATISAPHMHAIVLEQLESKLVPGAVVLDVGSGSGYLVSAMARMVQPGGRVYGIEHVPELVAFSKRNLDADAETRKLVAARAITIVEGDGRLGFPSAAPFDAIHVGAAAPTIPQTLLDQLAVGGRLVCPVGNGVGQELMQFDKEPGGRIQCQTVCGVMYVPLTSLESQEKSH